MEKPLYTFAADVHLGKLARMLRMMGFDTAYSNSWSFADLLAVASAQHRVVLSRNPQFALRPEITSIVIASDNYRAQLKQVELQLSIMKNSFPFSRCLTCNGTLAAVSKEKVAPFLKEQTQRYYQKFWQCVSCQKVYWEGPHYNRMVQFIQSFNPASEQGQMP
ncbi:MAG TPA: Mut7-C RNAse domain-containing protein [Flavisolibacter sp.]